MKNNLYGVLAVFSLSGCIVNYPKDIAVISIKSLDYREQAELAVSYGSHSLEFNDPYSDFLFALSEKKGKVPITSGDIKVYFQKQDGDQAFKNAKMQKPLLKIEFVSKVNLYKYVRKNGYTLLAESYFCRRPKASVLLSWPSVYWKGLNVSIPLNYDIQESEMLTYYFFLNMAYNYTGPSSYEHYDLRANPEDVCFQLRGGSIGIGYKSNIAVISQKDIVEALKINGK